MGILSYLFGNRKPGRASCLQQEPGAVTPQEAILCLSPAERRTQVEREGVYFCQTCGARGHSLAHIQENAFCCKSCSARLYVAYILAEAKAQGHASQWILQQVANAAFEKCQEPAIAISSLPARRKCKWCQSEIDLSSENCPSCGGLTPVLVAKKAPAKPTPTFYLLDRLAPTGVFTFDLGSPDEAAFKQAIGIISQWAREGNRKGLDELESVIRANCPSGSVCEFYQPRRVRSVEGALLVVASGSLIEMAKQGLLLKHVHDAQALIAQAELAGTLHDALLAIKAEVGPVEARQLDLLYAQLTINAKFIKATGG